MNARLSQKIKNPTKKHFNSISAAEFNFKNTILTKNIFRISILKL